MGSLNKYRVPDLITDEKSTFLKIWSVAPAYTYQNMSTEAQLVLKYLDKKSPAKRTEIMQNTNLSDYYLRKATDELLKAKLIVISGKSRATTYSWAPSLVETVDILNQMTDAVKSGRIVFDEKF